MCDLLDGLLTVTDSAYRAWYAERYGAEGRGGGASDAISLDWHGWDQSMMLQAQTYNLLQVLVKMWADGHGVKKYKPVFVEPPGVSDDAEKALADGGVDGILAMFQRQWGGAGCVM